MPERINPLKNYIVEARNFKPVDDSGYVKAMCGNIPVMVNLAKRLVVPIRETA